MRIVKPLIFAALFFLVVSSMAMAQMTSGATTVPPSAPIEPPPSAPASSTANKPLSAPLLAGSATVIRKEKTTPPPQIHEMALSDDPLPVLQPETFFTTAKASERYLQIVDRGGWPTIGAPVQAGAKSASIITLRRRLAVEDEMVQDLTKPVWDKELTAAIKRFQFRLGLKQTGVVAGATLRELDVPANVRFRQLASTAQRLAGVEFPFESRYVIVNIPSTAVDAVDNDRVTRRYVAIVGDPAHRSPEVSAKIGAVNINPTWTVPTSIIKNEIAPKMLKDPDYLRRAHIRVLNTQGEEVDPRSVNWASDRATSYTLRQDSGKNNSLGSIRIAMPNHYAVYMHDTPSRNLFANDYRFLSHGCVRVQGVIDFAAWLLDGSHGSKMDKDQIAQKIASGEAEEVRLTHSVPVVWVYMTGWASADGVVHFRDDVYHLDDNGDQ